MLNTYIQTSPESPTREPHVVLTRFHWKKA